MSFIIGIPCVIDASEGVLLVGVGLDEGRAFEFARRPQPTFRFRADEPGVMRPSN